MNTSGWLRTLPKRQSAPQGGPFNFGNLGRSKPPPQQVDSGAILGLLRNRGLLPGITPGQGNLNLPTGNVQPINPGNPLMGGVPTQGPSMAPVPPIFGGGGGLPGSAVGNVSPVNNAPLNPMKDAIMRKLGY